MMTSPGPRRSSERWLVLQHFRKLHPGLNQHFIRDMVYIWEEGYCLLLTDSETDRREWRAGGGAGSSELAG